ncbi:glycosyltransferase family 2 protein [Aequorivita todarodis]|uniref:glycosyltransferase family 2 protein n=1 Tax=Aequorivita todarodis TaxID=2036821 RepID=UPI00235091F5|nr:glycosyltransferase family 2 protein [Aequorivita todarodis]MDC8000097.1 glycosyltransferase family 2 protein [Aequorivita todarodis]
MSQNSLVSIIIPTFNRGHIIGETLNSVKAQSYQNWECIVIDDGSIDKTKEVINSYVKEDSRFKYYECPKNRLKGGNAARNYGFEMSKGHYIQWFDSDDIMFPDFLKKRFEIFSNYPDTDVVFCAFTYFDENGVQDRITNKSFNGNIIDDLIEKNISFSPLSYILKKEILDNLKFDETLRRAQDLDFFFRIFTTLKNIQIRHTSEVLFKVRKHENAISSDKDKSGIKLNSRFIVNKRILEYFSKQQSQKAMLKYKAQCLLDLKRMLENKNYRLVVINLLNFKYLNFEQKVYLLFCVTTQIFIGKGSSQFKSILN